MSDGYGRVWSVLVTQLKQGCKLNVPQESLEQLLKFCQPYVSAVQNNEAHIPECDRCVAITLQETSVGIS